MLSEITAIISYSVVIYLVSYYLVIYCSVPYCSICIDDDYTNLYSYSIIIIICILGVS